MFVLNVIKDSIQLGSEKKLKYYDVEFFNIYRRKKQHN